MAPASGPTIADAAALARDAATGLFTPTDGRGRSEAERRAIAARRAKVAELYPGMSPAQIGPRLGWSEHVIDKDVAWLVERGLVERQRGGARRKHPDPEPRVCIAPDCPRNGEPFTPPTWAPEQRYCSIPCARSDASRLVREKARELLTEQHRRAAEEVARLNAAGILTLKQFAAERKITESAVSRYIAVGLLRAERRVIEGEPHQLIRREEFDRFNAEEWPRILKRMGPGYPSNWGWLPVRRWTGRKAAPKGVRRGGRKPVEQVYPQGAQRVVELWADGQTLRDIADETGLTKREVEGVITRHRARASLSP